MYGMINTHPNQQDTLQTNIDIWHKLIKYILNHYNFLLQNKNIYDWQLQERCLYCYLQGTDKIIKCYKLMCMLDKIMKMKKISEASHASLMISYVLVELFFLLYIIDVCMIHNRFGAT